MKKALIFIPYCLLIVSVIILADIGRLPLFLLFKIPHYDWLAHAVLYGFFCIFLDYFLQKKEVYIIKKNISLSFMLTSILIIAEEFSQILFPSRTFSFMDLLMGFTGIMFFRMLAKYFVFLHAAGNKE